MAVQAAQYHKMFTLGLDLSAFLGPCQEKLTDTKILQPCKVGGVPGLSQAGLCTLYALGHMLSCLYSLPGVSQASEKFVNFW